MMRAGSRSRRHAVVILTAALILCFAFTGAPAETEKGGCAVTVYFPNWSVYSDSRCRVENLPWDRLDCVNHAFWKVAPRDGGYALVSTDPAADAEHFAQYAECLKKYPGKKVLLSVGGWTACGYFSEMALTEDTRGSFIKSCLDTLEKYPFLSGIDIDWEYPGVPRSGGADDEGNPVRGDDRTNYTLLLRELREALDARFGPGERLLTVCAGAVISTLRMQDYAALHPYVDRVNLMTYDLAGPWDPVTGHQTALYGSNSADAAVGYLRGLGVPAEKIAVGSPLYSHGWKLTAPAADPVGAAAAGLNSGDLTWKKLLPFERAAMPEGTPGWHKGYDEKRGAAWLFNDDPASEDYLTFYTYESVFSLDAKLGYIREKGLGGLIVWQVHGDAAEEDWPMITRMYRGLHP